MTGALNQRLRPLGHPDMCVFMALLGVSQITEISFSTFLGPIKNAVQASSTQAGQSQHGCVVLVVLAFLANINLVQIEVFSCSSTCHFIWLLMQTRGASPAD